MNVSVFNKIRGSMTKKIEDAFEELDWYFCCEETTRLKESWMAIKDHLGQPATNCPNCKSSYDVGIFNVCEKCGERWEV